jgi:tetratricopeptide (TPR) repeat protein
MKAARRLHRRAAALTLGLGLAGWFGAAIAHPGIDAQIQLLDARIAARPADAGLRLQRGELHRVRGEWEAAEADYRAAHRLDPSLAAADLALGRMLQEAGRHARALQAIDRFLAVRPDDPVGLLLRGRTLGALGRHPEAAAAFDRVITLASPTRLPEPELFLERARAQMASGEDRIDETIRGLDQGLALLGPVVSLQLEAIDLEVRRHTFDAALGRLATLEGLGDRRGPWLVRRAVILEAAGRHDEARAACDRALDAIATLPPERRAAPASGTLADECRARLSRLQPAAPGGH